MKKLTYITLGFVMGSLATTYVIRSGDTNASQTEQTARAPESELTFDFSVPNISFDIAPHDRFSGVDVLLPPESRRDYSSLRSEFIEDMIRDRLSQEAYDTINPYSIHNDEWKNRDYGLYVFSDAK